MFGKEFLFNRGTKGDKIKGSENKLDCPSLAPFLIPLIIYSVASTFPIKAQMIQSGQLSGDGRTKEDYKTRSRGQRNV